MGKKIKYRPKYTKLYPGLDISPEVLTALKKGDLRDEYESYFLKKARLIKDKSGKIAAVQPGREFSLEYMIERGVYFSDVSTEPEKVYIEREEINALYHAIASLKKEDRILLASIFFDRMSEKEYAAITGVRQQTIHKRKRAILKKIKIELEIQNLCC